MLFNDEDDLCRHEDDLWPEISFGGNFLLANGRWAPSTGHWALFGRWWTTGRCQLGSSVVLWQFCDGALERNQNMAASITLENQLKDLVIEENTEETEVVSEKEKDAPPPSLPPLEQAKVECVGVLEEKDKNILERELVCSHCKKSKPSKRCTKRHMKCLQKIFCNDTCEMLSHKKKEDANAENTKTENTKKVEAKKKKTKEKKKENIKHGHVRASIAYKDYE